MVAELIALRAAGGNSTAASTDPAATMCNSRNGEQFQHQQLNVKELDNIETLSKLVVEDQDGRVRGERRIGGNIGGRLSQEPRGDLKDDALVDAKAILAQAILAQDLA